MARYRKIDPRIWNDQKFASLSHEAQRMFFFVLTHPMMTALGAFRISKEGMAAEVGLSLEGFAKPFHELLEKGLLKYDERAFLVFAPNFLKYNEPENPNVIKGWQGAVDLLPECALTLEVLQRARACASKTEAGSKAFANTLERVCQTLSERFGKPSQKSMPKQEQEQEQDISTTPPVVPPHDEPELPMEAEAPKAEPKPDRAMVPFPSELPTQWLEDAKRVRTDIDPNAVFLKMKARFVSTTQRKTLGGWHKNWMTWIGREFPTNSAQRSSSGFAKSDKRFTVNQDEYYQNCMNPDGTVNYGI